MAAVHRSGAVHPSVRNVSAGEKLFERKSTHRNIRWNESSRVKYIVRYMDARNIRRDVDQ